MTVPKMTKLRIPSDSKPAQLAKHDAAGKQITVPITQQVFIERVIGVGDVIVFVGENGSGKSSILQNLYGEARSDGSALYLPGHRNIAFDSSDYALTTTRARHVLNSVLQGARTAGRIRSQQPQAELQAHIQTLVDAENEFNFRFRRGEVRADETSPIDALNNILAAAGLRPRLTIGTEGLRATVSGSRVTVDEFSDGERAALLLSAVVVCAPVGATLFIDEPERHLNQSIARSFVSALLLARSDLSFVLATHDLILAKALKPSATYVVHGCVPPSGDNHWLYKVEELTEGFDSDLGEAACRAILGGRARILFTEGELGSLDEAVYGNLFPQREVRPAGGCASVVESVKALRTHSSLHSVDAQGIVDRDSRTPDEIDRLAEMGIHAVPVSAIESLLCLEFVVGTVASVIAANVDGSDPVEKLRAAQDAARAEARKSKDAFVARLAEAIVRDQVDAALPTHRGLIKGVAASVVIDVAAAVARAQREIECVLADEVSFDAMISGLPIKHSGIPALIAKTLGLTSWGAYCRLVLHHMQAKSAEGVAIRSHLLSLMPTLA